MRFDRSIRTVFFVVLATLAIGGLGLRAAMQALDVYLKKEPVAMRGEFSTIPASLGNWKKIGDDVIMDAATIEALGTSKYLTRAYAYEGDPSKGVISLHLAYYTGMIDTVPHIPARCWGAAGLSQLGTDLLLPLEITLDSEVAANAPVNEATGEKYSTTQLENPITGISEAITLPVGDLGLTVSTFQNPNQTRRVQLAGYMFVANGRATPSTLGVRALAFNLTDKYAYYCKVQLSGVYPVGERDPQEVFKEQSEDFMSQLMPHLMRRLPDWPSVEANARAPTSS